MQYQGIITTLSSYIACDEIIPAGTELPGFYVLLLNGERVRVINGDYIIEVIEGKRNPNRPLITPITF